MKKRDVGYSDNGFEKQDKNMNMRYGGLSESDKKKFEEEIKSKYRKVARDKIKKISRQKRKIVKRYTAKRRALTKKVKAQEKKSYVPSGLVLILTIITFILACVVDLIDVLGEIGVELGAVPTAISYIINFCSSLIITFTWFIIFSGSKGKNKRQSKMIVRSVLVLFGVENIPVVELLPFNAIAVVLNFIDFKKGNKPKK